MMNLLLFMDVNLKLVDVAFCLLFVVWILWDAFKKRKEFGGGGDEEQFLRRESPSLSAKITVVLSCVVVVAYIAYLLHEFWELVNFPNEEVYSAMAWCFACMLVVYTISREGKRWPLILIVVAAELKLRPAENISNKSAAADKRNPEQEVCSEEDETVYKSDAVRGLKQQPVATKKNKMESRSSLRRPP